jgi:hypothetical protein
LTSPDAGHLKDEPDDACSAPQTQAWEFHVSDTPAQHEFRTVRVPGPISSHYNYPKPTDEIHITVKAFPHDLYSRPGRRSLKDLFSHDIPNSALQLTQFDDASIVGLSIPHVLADGHGAKEVARALVRALRGEEVAPIDPSSDPFAKFAGQPVPPPTPGWRLFSFFQMVVFVAGMLWDRLRYPKYEVREVYVPPKEVERIKRQATEDIRAELGEQTDAWVSTSDALVAFVLKVCRTRHLETLLALTTTSSGNVSLLDFE